jgi:hypothetical protein
MDSRIFKEWLQGSKPIGLKSFFYIIEKLLKHRCLKWACITHLDIWNISYGQKKGRESNWQFDSHPISLHAGGVRPTVEKLLTRATTLF